MVREYEIKWKSSDLTPQFRFVAMRNILPETVINSRVNGDTSKQTYEALRRLAADLVSDASEFGDAKKSDNGGCLDAMRVEDGTEEKRVHEMTEANIKDIVEQSLNRFVANGVEWRKRELLEWKRTRCW